MAGILREIGGVIRSVGIIGLVGVGVCQSFRSSVFLIRDIQVDPLSFQSPWKESILNQIESISTESVGLFQCDLLKLKKKLLQQEVLSQVQIQKKFPNTLFLKLFYKEPQAVIQDSEGFLTYLDENGIAFGSFDLAQSTSLPILIGFSNPSFRSVIQKKILPFLKHWNQSLQHIAPLSSVHWEEGFGFGILVSYSISQKPTAMHIPEMPKKWIHTLIRLGQEWDLHLADKLNRFLGVFSYLSEHSIVVREILIHSGKQMIARTQSDF